MATNAPPVAPPATPAVVDRPPPTRPVVDRPPRCASCGRALAEYAARPWSLRCRHCKQENKSAGPHGLTD